MVIRIGASGFGSRKTKEIGPIAKKGTYPTPSKADIEMTRDIAKAAQALSIAIHDHLVIGRKGHASFKSLNLL